MLWFGGCSEWGTPLTLNENRQYDKKSLLVYICKALPDWNTLTNQSTMSKQLDYISAHYHRVDTWTWLRVRQLLQGFLLGRLSAGCSRYVVELANEDFETIRDFCEQMDVGYLHPRRDSLHVALCQTMYGSMKIPARALERMRQQRLAHSCNEKKPKSNQK